MATLTKIGEAFFHELSCSVNCYGRVKKLPPNQQQQSPVFPKSSQDSVDDPLPLEESPHLPAASLSRFAAAGEFVKSTAKSTIDSTLSLTPDFVKTTAKSTFDTTVNLTPDFVKSTLSSSVEFVGSTVNSFLQDDQSTTDESFSGNSDGSSAPSTAPSPRSDVLMPSEEPEPEAAIEEVDDIARGGDSVDLVVEFDVVPAVEEKQQVDAVARDKTNLETSGAVDDASSEYSCIEEEEDKEVQMDTVEEEGEPFVFEKEDFWGPASIRDARGLEDAAPVSHLLRFDVIRHGDLSGASVLPWQGDASRELYREMGMRSRKSSYVATWLNLQKVSLLFVSRVIDEARLQMAISDGALSNRLKLILRPVRARIPFPVKAAPDADTIGYFFGQNASLVQHDGIDGIRHVCVQVDLYSKWQLRLAMQKVGFREGNILDMLVVDWPGRAVLSSCRVIVSKDLLQLMA